MAAGFTTQLWLGTVMKAVWATQVAVCSHGPRAAFQPRPGNKTSWSQAGNKGPLGPQNKRLVSHQLDQSEQVRARCQGYREVPVGRGIL